jgi:DNA-binding transcriptional LysR family regulator
MWVMNMPASSRAAGREGELHDRFTCPRWSHSIAAFGERYSEITLDITIDNNLSDIVAGGFDAGIRLGHALQRDMIAVPVGPMQQLTVVGSPHYFKRRGTPRTPHELLEHDCIRHRLNRARFFEWQKHIDELMPWHWAPQRPP